ncbi:SusC/RagA family TonB-linked outer membrane protein [Hanstruepera ponticola]|uniref:SusC/RagA family TonB-linked outer membrane protein n=1 Tax=Hanstruepera ponticola TaxID=2042995 RepID=UPI000CF0711A|nr:TonB-dependent receptor [Hanstruepera ponticola]
MKTTINSVLFLLFILPTFMFGQNLVTGTVTEQSSSLPLPGVNVIIKGTTTGTATDFDGNYQIQASNGDVLVFSYIGYITKEITYNGEANLDIALDEDAAQLDEVVVIGYGSIKKEDATGSVSLVTDDDFNKGNIVSTDQLINGKVAGVRITNAGGQPDAAPNIRIRGGSSLSGNNDPLIVIDGVPLSNINPAGVSNPLSLVNPNDVESFSILKDASATAIYGSRASNGVIIITTKKGTSGEPQFNFSTDVSVNSAGEGLDMMDSDTYVRFIQEYHPDLVDKLGVPIGSVQTSESISQIINTPGGPRAIYDTDWRDNVLRTAFTSNTNFNARANLFGKLPFRGSIGYTNAEGVVKTDDYERVTAAINLSPRFLDDNLKVTLNAKATYADKNSVDAGGALGGSLTFDPTKPVYNNASDNRFGGYYFNTNVDGNRLILDGQWNPLALLEQRERPERTTRFLGNLELDYSFDFLPGLRAVVNLGLDASQSTIKERYFDNAAATYRFDSSDSDINTNYVFNPGIHYQEHQHLTNTTLDAFVQYTKSYDDKFVSKFDVQAGYSYQNFKNDGNKDLYDYDNDTGLRFETFNQSNPNNRYYNVMNLQSFFGRANVDLLDRYLFTFSLRADASSLFVADDVWDADAWGFFPAAAFAWKVTSEDFMENLNFVNDLKIRVGWGRTGQQDISYAVGYYPTTPLFTAGGNNSQYLPGAGLYSALPFNPDLTWEKTTTYNLGVDFSFFKNNLIAGSFDIYKRFTEDLLAQVNVPPGQGFSDTFIKNVGEIEGKGFELNLILNAVQTDDFSVSLNGNLSYVYNEITDIGGQADINRGGSLRGTGAFLLSDVVGQQAQSASVFKQMYDSNGNPIPGAFADLNGDNVINDDDRYHVQIAPNWTYGFGLNFAYKNWDFSSGFIGQVGGNLYNFNKMNFGFTESVVPANNNSITNALNFYNGAADPAFENVNGNIQFSDYYLEDATFLRCNNLVLGYTFNDMIKNGNVRMYGAVTNPFTITDYDGMDPQNFGGIDRDFYPRPTTFTLGVNFDF